ncbi:MAG: sugar-transfer associated ATP-grasp domain-containing protein [Candidatus Hodarchaeota archaeon]
MKNFLKKITQNIISIYKIKTFNKKIAYIYRLKRKAYKYHFKEHKLIDYKKKWSVLKKGVNCKWYKIYGYISGKDSISFVPEDIYYSIIEPKMNKEDFLIAYKDKNFYDTYYSNNLFPRALLRNIDGVYYDREYNLLPLEKVNENLHEYFDNKRKIIVKPSVGSSGGRNVYLFNKEKKVYINSDNEILSLSFLEKKLKKNFIIQEYIEQHRYFKQFNNTSLNTVRIFTYRSVCSEEIIVLHAVLRIGKKGSIVDNQASGGISCGIDQNGKINNFAIDKYGNIYKKFGSSFFLNNFENIVKFDEMKKLAKKIARKNYYSRLLGMDFCVDMNTNVRLIEINNKNLEINFLQMNNGPLFKDYTDEVINYCLENK